MGDFAVISIAAKFIRHLDSLERMINYSELIEDERKSNDEENRSIDDLLELVINKKIMDNMIEEESSTRRESEAEYEDITKSFSEMLERNKLLRFINNNIEIVKNDRDEIRFYSENGFVNKVFMDHMGRTEDIDSDINQLLNSIIISLVISIELLIAELFKDFFKNIDKSNYINAKTLSFSDLSKIGSIEEAKVYLIDEYIEKLLNQSFIQWIDELEKILKINVRKNELLNNEIEHVFETIQRRHLLVHNDGIVNSFYLNKVHSDLTGGLSKDDRLENNKAYIITSIERIRKFGVVLLYEYGLKIYRHDRDEFFGKYISLILDLSIRGCLGSRSVFRRAYTENLFNHKNKLMSQVNYYLSFHLNNEFEEIRAEVEEFSVDTLSAEFKMAKHILLGDFHTALGYFKTFCSTLDDDEFIFVIDWPILKLTKNDTEFNTYINDKIESIINHEEDAEVEV